MRLLGKDNKRPQRRIGPPSGCWYCNRIWQEQLQNNKLPYTFEPRAGRGDMFRHWRHVSLACRPGRLLVRAVFKLVTKPEDDTWSNVVLTIGSKEDAWGTLGGKPNPITRCALELPRFDAAAAQGQTSKSEIDAALRSKEVNCKPSSDFGDLKVGSWYSDTFQFDFEGCDGLNKPGVITYTPTTHSIVSNPRRPGLLLAKFEVQEA